MAGIAGILKPQKKEHVTRMLETISHRGKYGKAIFEFDDATIGMVWSYHENEAVTTNLKNNIFMDGPGYGQFAKVSLDAGKWTLTRDEIGVAPMYFVKNGTGNLCFASEIKALLSISNEIFELPPAHSLNELALLENYQVKERIHTNQSDDSVASELLSLLSQSVSRRISSDTFGSWLSGGLDSSTMAALARPWVSKLHTFAGGLENAPDLEFARHVAKYIGSQHHEIIITIDEIVHALPDLILHLESFDALLVRSSIINYLVSKTASEYVEEVFSGEGGDEFFAGYHYLKNIPQEELDRELIDITKRLHNTALQRVDRSAASFGTTAHVIFADPEVFEYALEIPVSMKLRNGIEKWILRKAMDGMLPESVLNRSKAKFWEGSGVESLISDFVSSKISDSDFRVERNLRNGWILNSKEELYYYRLFKDSFGELSNLDWMGRTKGSPIT
jgi:asparagine synthase (glutamine-hydrolysing)